MAFFKEFQRNVLTPLLAAWLLKDTPYITAMRGRNQARALPERFPTPETYSKVSSLDESLQTPDHEECPPNRRSPDAGPRCLP